ncbi:ABC transporter permease [Pelobacter seleniigenes]|uniref:ABC transporter permease n=1 Tax=Pelobacter seleniigenes TaxID=407188 RepID=UPI0004A6E11F|nr:ABC transporter permease [Pelobacter seleniigenes]
MKVRMINRKPDRHLSIFLTLLPFALVLLAYVVGSEIRLAANPNDKLLPGLHSFADAIARVAFEPDKRSGDYLLWTDTLASLARLGCGMLVATLLGMTVGVHIGLLPLFRAGLLPFVTVVSMLPPLAVLPILFIVFGLGEVAKVALIVIGITPVIIRDIALRVEEIPREQLIKAQTLGASSWQLAVRVILPQVWPRLIDAVRLTLGSAWLFLIAAEAIAAQSGLGYRIFLLRRYLAMDTILPYVAWITFLAFSLDFLLRRTQSLLFPWFAAERGR